MHRYICMIITRMDFSCFFRTFLPPFSFLLDVYGALVKKEEKKRSSIAHPSWRRRWSRHGAKNFVDNESQTAPMHIGWFFAKAFQIFEKSVWKVMNMLLFPKGSYKPFKIWKNHIFCDQFERDFVNFQIVPLCDNVEWFQEEK